MNKPILLALLLSVLFGCSRDTTLVLEDSSRNRLISYDLWALEEDDQTHPLVLLSHGSGGDYTNHDWLIQALVSHGYIVAAVNHPGNTTRDNTDKGIISVWDRPADLSLLLDTILVDEQWKGRIDSSRIGAVGFSSGGYTVLALGGAIYDSELITQYCNSDDHGPDCDLASDSSEVDFSRSSLSYLDQRVSVIFAMAPAVGSAITTNSLAGFTVPVMIMASRDDELVYPAHNAIRYAENIPGASLELLPGGGHFIFLQCNVGTQIADWFIEELDLCGAAFEVDREQVRKTVAAKAIEFLEENFGV